MEENNLSQLFNFDYNVEAPESSQAASKTLPSLLTEELIATPSSNGTPDFQVPTADAPKMEKNSPGPIPTKERPKPLTSVILASSKIDSGCENAHKSARGKQDGGRTGC